MKIFNRNVTSAWVSLAFTLSVMSGVAPVETGAAASSSTTPATTSSVTPAKPNPLNYFTDGLTIVFLSAKTSELRPIKEEDGMLMREDKKDIPLHHKSYQFQILRKDNQISLVSSKTSTPLQRNTDGSVSFGKMTLVKDGGKTLFFSPEFTGGPYSVATLKTDDGQYLSVGDDNKFMLSKEKNDGAKFRLVRLDDKVRKKVRELIRKTDKPEDKKTDESKPVDVVEKKPEAVAAAVEQAAKVAGGAEFTYKPILNRNITFSESWKLPAEGSGAVVFDARAKRRLAVAFSPVANQLPSGMYVAIIGRDFNTRTMIGHTKKYDRKDREFIFEKNPLIIDVKKNGDPKALISGGQPADGQEWGSYWIQVDQGTVVYGRGRELGKSVIGKFVDTDPLKFVKYVGFGGGAVPVEIKNIEIKAAVKIEEAASSTTTATTPAATTEAAAATTATSSTTTPATTETKSLVGVPTGFEEEGFKGSDMTVGVRVRDGKSEHVFYAIKDGALYYRQPGTMAKDPWVKQDMPAGVTFKHVKITDGGLTALSTDGKVFVFQEPVATPVVPLAKLGEIAPSTTTQAGTLVVPGAESKPAESAAPKASTKKVVKKRAKSATKRVAKSARKKSSPRTAKKSGTKKSATKRTTPIKRVATKRLTTTPKKNIATEIISTTPAPVAEVKPAEVLAPLAPVTPAVTEEKPAVEAAKPAAIPA